MRSLKKKMFKVGHTHSSVKMDFTKTSCQATMAPLSVLWIPPLYIMYIHCGVGDPLI